MESSFISPMEASFITPRGVFAALLAFMLWASGFRRRVIDRNLAYIGGNIGGNARLRFRWRLCFAASRDFLALLSGAIPRTAPPARSATLLETMKTGPSLLLTAHFHNWEALAGALRSRGVPLLGAARPLRNPWAENFLRFLRRRLGVPVVSEKWALAGLRHLGQSRCFGLLWDQHSPASEFTGRFFGHTVLLNPLPFFLLRHHPCPVFFGVFLPGGNLRLIRILPEIEGAWERKLIRRYHRVLETLIRMHPQFWYGFFHARFKNIAPYPGHF